MPRSLAISGFFRPSQLVGGVASYFQNLTRGMHEVVATDPRYRDLTVTVFHGAAGVPYRVPGFEYRETGGPPFKYGREFAFGLRDSRAFDATLFPNYFRPPIVRSRRSVTVFHDLLERRMPELKTWSSRAWLAWARTYSLRHSDRVVTISDEVRQDILRWFGQKWESKVRRIWNPIAFERLDGSSQQTISGGRPYLLAVAVDRPSKNLYTLIRAFQRIRERFPDHLLVLAGELRSRRPKGKIHSEKVAAEMPPAEDLVRDLGLEEHVKVTGFVSDEELGALYRGADVFVMPSIFEGFGMPPIESLAMGTPTLVSGIPVLREVTLNLAQYIDQPRDVEAVSHAVAEILANPQAYRPCAETISRVRETFAPATIATQYLDVLFES